MQLKSHIVSSWYTGFNCTKSQLTDLLTRIDLFTATRRDIDRLQLITQERMSNLPFTCDYWNNRIMENCTHREKAFSFVQSNILGSSNSVRAECTEISNLCPLFCTPVF